VRAYLAELNSQTHRKKILNHSFPSSKFFSCDFLFDLDENRIDSLWQTKYLIDFCYDDVTLTLTSLPVKSPLGLEFPSCFVLSKFSKTFFFFFI